MSKRTRLAPALLAALALTISGAQAAEKEDRARAATQELVTQANQALASNNAAALRGAIQNAFDFETWERFLIEPRADRFSPEQRAQFKQLLPGYLAHLYNQQFDRGLGTPPTVGEAKPARKDTLVGATFKRANGGDLPVQWRLRETGGRPQVIDVMVGGTSFLLLKRDEFASMVDRGGPEALLAYMQQNSM